MRDAVYWLHLTCVIVARVNNMRLFLYLIVWLIVLALLPAVAIAAVVLFPIVWLLALPFRLAGLVTDAAFELLRALLLLPARLLGRQANHC
jgi:hypothetical protein